MYHTIIDLALGPQEAFPPQNFEEFLTQLNSVYYHKNNRVFWKIVKEIDERFWNLKKVYFAKYGFQAYAKTALFVAELLKEFGFMLFKTADGYINEILPNISKEYKDRKSVV